MKQALALAARGLGSVTPNPMVGAVLVVNNQIIGKGYHQKAGREHAEVNAIASVSNSDLLTQATLYVTLEPCNHHGRTPPCTHAILAAGIPSVVIGSPDLNPLTAGAGSTRLKEAGVHVTEGIEVPACIMLNKRYYTNQFKKRPYIILKWAETADGFIARKDGTSKWISSSSARVTVHQMRAIEDAILVGTNTARIDNPELTVRHTTGRNPIRIILDKTLSIPTTHAVFNDRADTIIVNEQRNDLNGSIRYLKASLASKDPAEFLSSLYELGICSILVEGGAKVLESFIAHDLWDETFVFKSTVTFDSGIPAPELPYPGKEIDRFENTKLYFSTNPANPVHRGVLP
jgi:diaminohydroxyphosphoribosylaminopyrimidine deaminase / 5-amino-6-(5-phosphoribosylamino)uracil reductase